MRYALVVVFPFFFLTHAICQEITMFKGFWRQEYYQDNQEISKKQVESLMMDNAEAARYWRMSKTRNTVSWTLVGAEAGCIAWYISAKNKDVRSGNTRETSTVIPFLGFLFTAAMSGGFKASSYAMKKKAILWYNNGLGRDSFIKPVPDGFGISMSLQF